MKFRKGQRVMVKNITQDKIIFITVPRTGMCDIMLKRWLVAVEEKAEPTDKLEFLKM